MDSSMLKAEGRAACPGMLHVASVENGDDCHHQAVSGDSGAQTGPDEMLNWFEW